MSKITAKLGGMDISEFDLKELTQNKEWKDVIKKIDPVIAEMDPDMLSYCQDKISNIYDKYLNVEGEPNYEEAAKILKNDMERDNGPTWICIIGRNFSFNIKSQKEACLYCYLGHFGILLYKC
jgi:hypothetical protein